MKNYGIILEKPKQEDYILGQGKVDNKIIAHNGQWDSYLPINEYQRIKFETMACVTFSALNCLEAYWKAVYGYEVNFSDRFTAKMSGTTHNGNYISNVANSIRRDGLVYEQDYPMVNNWQDYYRNVPFAIRMKGQKWLREYEVKYEWVSTMPTDPNQKELLMEALKYSPVQVIVWAWKKQGQYYVNYGNSYNHAVMLYGYEKGKYWKIFDHYDNTHKKLAWNYKFASAKKYTIHKKGKLFKTSYDGIIDGFKFNKGILLTAKEFWRVIFKR